MIRIRGRNKAPHQLGGPAGADDNRVFANGFLQRSINMPLMDSLLAFVSVTKNFLIPTIFFFPELVETSGIFFLDASFF
jgi:hypothetical protein